ncbi:MAG TPA: DUF3857 and transglutaminase domain-containing protein [Thermoanaerobaculia bacterium]|nr:DUF3857 and transglutaminase domain-containing protein [Thermoanaerobaculia bacterium]
MTRNVLFALSLVLSPVLFAGAPPAWVLSAAATKVPIAKDAKAAVLLEEAEVIVQADGTITTRQRKVTKILTAAGRDYGFAAVPFDRDTKLLHLRGWSIAANGTQYELKERDAVEMTPYSGELYSDDRVKMLRLPADIGSVVAYEYEQRERPYMMQTLWHFQDDLPVALSRFRLTLAPGWSYDARWSHHAPVEPMASANVAAWELRDVPPIADEPKMPHTMALAGRMAVRLIRPNAPQGPQSWSDIAQFFAGLASTRDAATPALQTKVRELTNGAATLDSVRALARFAQRDVRYVAIEIGIGGYQPHPAGEIFTNRYGDCKDKATLLRTMLREIGIDSYYVLVHSRRGVVDPELPTMYAFNHVILAIRVPQTNSPLLALIDHPKAGKLLLFDPTSTTTPFGHLPSYLQDSRGLLVLGDGGELIALPAHAPQANQLRRTAKLQLAPDGTLKGQVEEVRTGRIAAEMRDELQAMTASERTRYVESALAAHVARSTLAGLAIENVDDPEADLVTRYTLIAPSYATRVGEMVLIRPRVLGQKSEQQVALADRQYGYVTEGPSVQTDDIEIVVPEPLKVDELPSPVDVKTPSVQYTSKSEFKDGTLRYKRQYALQTWFVGRDALPELNKVFAQVLSDERASAIFK